MTQNFTDIKPTDLVGESLDPIKDRDQANKTNFMGTSFPEVTVKDVGMSCVIIKTENDILYRQVWRLVDYKDNQPVWQLERDLNKGLVYSNNETDKAIDDYQAKSDLLTSLAEQEATGTQTNKDKLPYLSDNNEFSLAELTSLARRFLAAADTPAARQVLGLGSLSTKNTITGSDIGTNAIQLSNLATGQYGKTISYTANGQPTLVSLPSGTPVGVIEMWSSTVLPDNSWIFLYGQQLNITDYPELWAHATASNNIVSNYDDWTNNRKGSFYKESNTVFRVPDLRNFFIRAWDGPTGPTRVIGSVQGDAIRNITFTGSWHLMGQTTNGSTTGALYSLNQQGTANSGGTVFSAPMGLGFDASRVVPTANENRPRNIVFPFIMKARPLPV